MGAYRAVGVQNPQVHVCNAKSLQQLQGQQQRLNAEQSDTPRRPGGHDAHPPTWVTVIHGILGNASTRFGSSTSSLCHALRKRGLICS